MSAQAPVSPVRRPDDKIFLTDLGSGSDEESEGVCVNGANCFRLDRDVLSDRVAAPFESRTARLKLIHDVQ